MKKNKSKLDEILFNITSLKSLIFQPYQSLEPLAPLEGVGEIAICARGLFCIKFNSEQFLL